MRKYSISPWVLGRQYNKRIEYFKNLKILVKACPFRRAPVGMREIIKELAMEMSERDNILP